MFRTLIVEDHAPFRKSLHHVLARNFPFMAIEEAASGEDALAQAAVAPPNFVFMDLRLPGKNGLDTTRELKSAAGYAAVCVITSFDVPEYREAAMRCGADHFLIKGEAGEAQIVSAVDKLLASRLKCLIIENDAAARLLLERTLIRRWPGMLVVEAADGPQGLKDLRALKPEVVFLDLGLLNGMDIALAAAIKGQCPQAELIAISGDEPVGCRRAAMSAGAAYFIAKADCCSEEWLPCVESVLARREQAN